MHENKCVFIVFRFLEFFFEPLKLFFGKIPVLIVQHYKERIPVGEGKFRLATVFIEKRKALPAVIYIVILGKKLKDL